VELPFAVFANMNTRGAGYRRSHRGAAHARTSTTAAI